MSGGDLSAFPRLGVGLQLNGPGRDYISYVGDLVDLIEVPLDSIMGGVDGPYVMTPTRVPFIADLATRFQLVGHSNYGCDFGFDPVEDTIAMRRHVPIARRLSCRWVTNHSFYGDSSRANVWVSPLQYSLPEARRVADRARQLQDAYGVPLGHENSAYSHLCPGGSLQEAEFLAEVVTRAGTFLHVDLHNLYANEQNHPGYSALDFIRTVPSERIMVVHLAGGDWVDGYYYDSHCSAVPEPVWGLLDELLARCLPGALVFEYSRRHLLDDSRDLTETESIAAIRADLERAGKVWHRAQEAWNSTDVLAG